MLLDDNDDDDDDADDDDEDDDDADDDDDDIIIRNTRWLWAISQIWKIWDLTCKISSYHHEVVKSRHPLELYIDLGSNM